MTPKFFEKAKCKDHSLNLFYPEDPEKRKQNPKIYRSAKNICANCPVMMECLVHAVETPEPRGVWGGKDPNERRAIFIKLYGYKAWTEVRKEHGL